MILGWIIFLEWVSIALCWVGNILISAESSLSLLIIAMTNFSVYYWLHDYRYEFEIALYNKSKWGKKC